MERIVFTLIFLFFFCTDADAAVDNPFMQMAGKKYADYSQQLHDHYLRFRNLDTIEAKKFIRQVAEVGEKTGSMEWKLRAARLEVELLNWKQSIYGEELFPSEMILKKEFDLLEKAKKANSLRMELEFRYMIIEYYWHHFKNYELAFEQCAFQDECLQKISIEDFPEKSGYYVQIADAYYYFKDYPKAISYFSKIIEEKENPRNQPFKQKARNSMGLCYRYGYNDLDRSDSCFYAIMQVEYIRPEEEYYRDIWDGIAEGNIGYNLFLRQEYDKAIPLLKSSIEKMLKYGDYAYASGPAINLADIYLKKGNPTQAKRYIDLAREYYTKMPRDGRLSRIYEVLSKYHTAMGNVKLSADYMDSTLSENKKYENQFSALQLMRAKQRIFRLEQKTKDEQIKTEKVRSTGYLTSLAIAAVGLLLLGCVLLRYLALYRKKKAAYRELVLKSQQWAASEQEQKTQNDYPDECDLLTMNNIEQAMLEERLYTDSSLSLDLLAQKLGSKRNYISMVINRCTNKNFNILVNEYRVKEAIQLLSRKDAKTFSIDQIAFKSGFSNRKNFHRVFKKITGLSPTEFRDNVGGD